MEQKPTEKELKQLRLELEACRNERDEYLRGWQRAKADYTNSERAFSERSEIIRKHTEASVIKEFLEVVDTFEHAFNSSPPDSLWVEGIKQTYEKILKILSAHGVEAIQTEHERFNPEFHEAVEMVPRELEEEDEMIAGEVQKGYLIHGRVLRPSRVRVGRFQQ